MRRPTLTFHGVGAPPRPLSPGEEGVWLSESAFESALDAVPAESAVRLTFDDGNASDTAIALPALVRRGLTAMFFIVTNRLDEPGFIAATDIPRLIAAGMDVGTHGNAHLDWRSLSDWVLRDEIQTSQARLAALGKRPVDAASCPFGSYDRRILKVLRACGLRRVYTSDGGWSAPTSWLQRRTTVTPTMTHTEIIELVTRPPNATEQTVLAVKQLAKKIR